MATELVARAIAQQDWLDPVADTAQPAIDRALTAAGGQPLKDFLNGVWLGHPLHPVLTDIPIGAWTMTAVLDALEEINGHNGARQGADTALKIGLVGAVGAAVTGMADWEHLDGQPRRVGLMHALLNTTAAALYARSWQLRNRRQRRGSFLVRNIFTDLKRHDLGPTFHERRFDGTLTTQFVTTPLWGVGTTVPYGHDGRSINLREVILRHGGEAQAQRDAFAQLSPNRQEALLRFLESLVLFPPDDTASNLDPGDSTTPDFPQRGHGSVNLSVLFNNPHDLE
jgi:hypothetical protein